VAPLVALVTSDNKTKQKILYIASVYQSKSKRLKARETKNIK
jgi:hypothetical protein